MIGDLQNQMREVRMDERLFINKRISPDRVLQVRRKGAQKAQQKGEEMTDKVLKIGRRKTTVAGNGVGCSCSYHRSFLSITHDGQFEIEDEFGGWGMELSELRAHVNWAEECLKYLDTSKKVRK